jgi:hypothetical protein
MSKITFADKSQVASYDATKVNAQDLNEIKNSVNSLYEYTTFRCLLTQSLVAAPTFSVIKNDTGITFTATYDSPGQYFLTPNVLPSILKVYYAIGTPQSLFRNLQLTIRYDSSKFIIRCVNLEDGTGFDNAINSIPLEILIYE